MADRGRDGRRKGEKRPGLLRRLFGALSALFGLFMLRRALTDDGGVPPAPSSMHAGYELRDMRPAQVIRWLALLVVAVTGLVILVTIFEALMIGHLGNVVSVVGNPPNVQPPPAPQLETANGQVLSDIHAKEDQLLNNYTWIDQASGTVRIPIDRAIELTVQRGLPVGQGQQGQAQGGVLTRPEESSSGRQMETAP